MGNVDTMDRSILTEYDICRLNLRVIKYDSGTVQDLLYYSTYADRYYNPQEYYRWLTQVFDFNQNLFVYCLQSQLQGELVYSSEKIETAIKARVTTISTIARFVWVNLFAVKLHLIENLQHNSNGGMASKFFPIVSRDEAVKINIAMENAKDILEAYKFSPSIKNKIEVQLEKILSKEKQVIQNQKIFDESE